MWRPPRRADAELNLSRTSIRAPFNAVVLSENVDVGQVVGSASQVAILAGTDRVRVEASVPYDRLSSLAIPGVDGVTADEASTATVRHTLGDGSAIVRSGRVVGMGGQLDPQTRTATVLLTIDAPYDPPGGGLPLLIGAFVDITIDGRSVDEASSFPGPPCTTATRSGSWAMTASRAPDRGDRLGHRRRTAGPLGPSGGR